MRFFWYSLAFIMALINSIISVKTMVISDRLYAQQEQLAKLDDQIRDTQYTLWQKKRSEVLATYAESGYRPLNSVPKIIMQQPDPIATD